MTRYTLVVGTHNWSSWSLRPYLALAAVGSAGIAFRTEVVILRQPSTRDMILKHSPTGMVPVLKIENGNPPQTVWDSLAICETLAERHPDVGLWPRDARDRARARSLSAEMHSGYPDLRDQLPMDFARTLPLPDLRDTTRAQIDRMLGVWADILAASGGPFLFGTFTIADAMFAPVVSRFLTYGVEVPPAARAYMDTVMALPGMQHWLAESQKEVAAGLA